MAPTAVRMVLVEGENGDGATVEEDNFEVAGDSDTANASAANQVVSAILGTREGAAQGGYQLTSTGVTWTDPLEAAALRDALAVHKVENVMLVSAFLAAAALAHAVGSETNYTQTALLFIEPDTATLAIVDTADGSIADVHRQALADDDDTAVAQLAAMVSDAEELDTRPDGVLVVGSGIDIPLIKPALEAATSLPLTAPDEPAAALARGAALASANAPLFASSTAARAYAQDPGTGAMDSYALAPNYFDVPAGEYDSSLAYSATPDEFTGTQTVVVGEAERKPFLLLGSVLASIFIIGVVALVVSLAVSIRTTAGVRPDPGQSVVAPTQAAPVAPAAPAAPAPAAPAPAAPAPEAQVPASVPQAPAPAPVSVPEAPAPAATVPDAPAPVPDAPAPAAPAPAVPAPAAPAPVPVAPIPVPIPLPIFGGPVIGGPFGGGGHGGGGFPGGGGHGHGGFGHR
nr:hypothetical protein [Mycobacterium sp.]